jgi:hypothetical protein
VYEWLYLLVGNRGGMSKRREPDERSEWANCFNVVLVIFAIVITAWYLYQFFLHLP